MLLRCGAHVRSCVVLLVAPVQVQAKLRLAALDRLRVGLLKRLAKERIDVLGLGCCGR